MKKKTPEEWKSWYSADIRRELQNALAGPRQELAKAEEALADTNAQVAKIEAKIQQAQEFRAATIEDADPRQVDETVRKAVDAGREQEVLKEILDHARAPIPTLETRISRAQEAVSTAARSTMRRLLDEAQREFDADLEPVITGRIQAFSDAVLQVVQETDAPVRVPDQYRLDLNSFGFLVTGPDKH